MNINIDPKIFPIIHDVLSDIISERIQSQQIQLGWSNNIKEFNIENITLNLDNDYLCLITYFEKEKKFHKQIYIESKNVTYIMRSKKLNKLGI